MSDRIPPTTQVCSDYQLLSIVVHNIIDNAVKYTNGGLVEFKVDEVENGVELTISNSGSTMPVEKRILLTCLTTTINPFKARPGVERWVC